MPFYQTDEVIKADGEIDSLLFQQAHDRLIRWLSQEFGRANHALTVAPVFLTLASDNLSGAVLPASPFQLL